MNENLQTALLVSGALCAAVAIVYAVALTLRRFRTARELLSRTNDPLENSTSLGAKYRAEQKRLAREEWKRVNPDEPYPPALQDESDAHVIKVPPAPNEKAQAAK